MRQTTSNLGEIKRSKGFSIKQLAKSSYYSILIGYRKNDLETQMLLNLRKSSWDTGFRLNNNSKKNDEVLHPFNSRVLLYKALPF